MTQFGVLIVGIRAICDVWLLQWAVMVCFFIVPAYPTPLTIWRRWSFTSLAWSPGTSVGPVGSKALASVAQIVVGLAPIGCSAAVARALSCQQCSEIAEGSEGPEG